MHHRATLRFGRGSPASYCWTWWSAPTCTALADRRPSPGTATCLTNTSSPPSIRRATTSGPRPKGASDEHDESRPHHDDDLRPRSSRHGPSELLGPSSPQQDADSASLAEQHPGQGSAQPGGPWVTPTVSCAGRASAEDAPSAPLPAGARPPRWTMSTLGPGVVTNSGWLELRDSYVRHPAARAHRRRRNGQHPRPCTSTPQLTATSCGWAGWRERAEVSSGRLDWPPGDLSLAGLRTSA